MHLCIFHVHKETIMSKTVLTIKNEDFLINGLLTYSEIPQSQAKGLLLNARFVQGIFDDKAGRDRYNRFGKIFDPEKNTDDLIASLKDWYDYGLRAFTIGIQGGGPCYTIENREIDNNPFSPDGKTIDQAYWSRLLRLISAADKIGMVVIVSIFYEGQLKRLESNEAVIEALKLVCRGLKEQGYTNVIIEPCNEHNLNTPHDVITTEEGMAKLIDIAKELSGMPVGCSGTGGYFGKLSAEHSDVIFIHGNGQTRNKLNQLIMKAKKYCPLKPIVVNEDSQDLTNLDVCIAQHVSWGYYNNLTKQEPPVDWSITLGEDEYFAKRMAEAVGIKTPQLENEYRLMGLEKDVHCQLMPYGTMWRRIKMYDEYAQISGGDMRFLRLASLYPERINYVDFFIDGKLIERVYDSPFTVNQMSNWSQGPLFDLDVNADVYAIVHNRDGRTCKVTKPL